MSLWWRGFPAARQVTQARANAAVEVEQCIAKFSVRSKNTFLLYDHPKPGCWDTLPHLIYDYAFLAPIVPWSRASFIVAYWFVCHDAPE